MTSDLALVLTLLAAAVAMFLRGRPRTDVVAVAMMAALPMTGVITMQEALAGFADPNVILIAALFVLGEGLVRTGIAQRIGDLLARRAGASEIRLIVLLMLAVAGTGAFMSSTGVVAIFIPVVLRIARKSGIPAARLLMPLAVAALVSGMMTLVATPPNLIVHGELTRRGLEGFGFFAVTPFGLAMLMLAILYMLAVRRRLGGDSPPEAGRPGFARWIGEYGLAARERRLELLPGSDLAGRRLADLDLRASEGVGIVAIERRSRFGHSLIEPRAQTRLIAGDVLLLDIGGRGFDIEDFCRSRRLRPLPLTGRYFADKAQEIGMAEVMVPPGSPLAGRTLVELRFRSERDLSVIGMRQGRDLVTGALTAQALKAGDTLLVAGPWRAIRRLAGERDDLILLDLPAEFDEVIPARNRAPLAALTLAAVVAMMVTGIVPNVQAALIGCLAMGLFRCIDMEAAYRAIHWKSLVLIVGMLPFSIALERSGGVDLAAAGLMAATGAAGPHLALAALFVVTAVMGLFISNTATAVLMAPVALALAEAMGLAPHPFAMTVALAASAAFMTPVSSPVNTLVAGPGDFGFAAFLRIGVPLALIAMGVAVVLVPFIMPF